MPSQGLSFCWRLLTELREGLNPISKAAPAFRVSASLFMSWRGLTAVLVVTALLITAGVKPHPAGGYKSRLLPISADPGFNRGLSGGQRDQSPAHGCVHRVPAEQPLLLGSSPSIHPPTHPVGILNSSLLPVPEEIKASPSSGGHVAGSGQAPYPPGRSGFPAKHHLFASVCALPGQWEGMLEGK